MREYVNFPIYLQQNQNDELLRPIPAISESNAHVGCAPYLRTLIYALIYSSLLVFEGTFNFRFSVILVL